MSPQQRLRVPAQIALASIATGTAGWMTLLAYILLHAGS